MSSMLSDTSDRPIPSLSQAVMSKIGLFLRGQVISVFIAGTGIFATFLSNTKPRSANFPTLMSLMNYVLLSTYLFRVYCYRIYDKKIELFPSPSKPWNSDDNIRKPIYWYIFAAFLDMEANYMVILAYNYTSITSVMLLDCFTIPSAMVLSYYFLSYQYTYKHILGALVCIAGLIIIVVTDFTSNSSSSSPSSSLLGDTFCLIGAALYAASNVLQEHIVKTHNREEYLGLIGAFGSLFAFIQCLIVDLPAMERTEFSYEVILYIFGFVGCLFFMYANTSMFLVESDATLFNLSLLTSDVYAVIFSYFLTGQLVHWEYFLSFGLIVLGLYYYHHEPAPSELIHSSTHSTSSSTSNDDPLSNPKNKYSLVVDTISPLSEHRINVHKMESQSND